MVTGFAASSAFDSVRRLGSRIDDDLSGIVELDGETYELDWPRQTKLLDFLLAQGVKAPYSCRQGQCSACACILDEGEVRMLHNEILEPEDLDEGYVLGCQSVPLTDKVKIRYS